jgi:hypothetical protein
VHVQTNVIYVALFLCYGRAFNNCINFFISYYPSLLFHFHILCLEFFYTLPFQKVQLNSIYFCWCLSFWYIRIIRLQIFLYSTNHAQQRNYWAPSVHSTVRYSSCEFASHTATQAANYQCSVRTELHCRGHYVSTNPIKTTMHQPNLTFTLTWGLKKGLSTSSVISAMTIAH